mgnify:CR=1 FL=1
MYYILLRILISIIIAYLFVVFLFTGFTALVTHETFGLLFVVVFLVAIVLGVVFSIKHRKTLPLKLAFLLIVVLSLFPGKIFEKEAKEAQAMIEKELHDAAQIHTISEMNNDELNGLIGNAKAEISKKYTLMNMEPVAVFMQNESSYENEYLLSVLMYGLYNDCDAYIVCEFRSLARNEDNSLTYRTIAMSSIEEDINRCMTSANLTTEIIDSKICNEVLMDKCNFVLSSGNDNESYEAMNYQTYEDIPQSLRANYEADSYNRLLKDTSIADNNYYLFYMASGGGASVPDNGVPN